MDVPGNRLPIERQLPGDPSLVAATLVQCWNCL